LKFDELVKSSPARAGQGTQKIMVGAIHELPLKARPKDEVEAPQMDFLRDHQICNLKPMGPVGSGRNGAGHQFIQ
jgi:hypothetical protein